MAKGGRWHRKVGGVLFLLYLMMLAYFMFFSEEFGRTVRDGYSYNLVPFREIRRFFTYREQLGIKAFLINMGGNVIAFMPFGFFLPVIAVSCRKWYQTVILSFLFSLTLEVSQLISRVGSFDVDDLILNTLGGALGFCVFVALRRMRRFYAGTDR